MQPDDIEVIPPEKPVDPDIKTDKQFRYCCKGIDFRKFYRNGSCYVGRINLYGKWNNIMYFLFRKFVKKTHKSRPFDNHFNIH